MTLAPQLRQQPRDENVEIYDRFSVSKPTLSEVWDASRALQDQDNSDAHSRRLDRAYAPIITAINEVRRKEGKPLLLSPSQGALVSDEPINARGGPAGIATPATGLWDRTAQDAAEAQVAREVKRIQRQYPGALKGVPDTADRIMAPIVQADQVTRDKSREVLGRSYGIGQGLAAFAGAASKGFEDPVNLMTLPIGGGGKTLVQVIAREALVNGLSEALQIPFVRQNRAELGEELTTGESIEMIGTAAVAGGALGGGLHAGGKALGYLGRKAPSVLDAIRDRLGLKPDAPVTDRDVAGAAEQILGTDRLTPDERAATQVIERDAEVAATSPYRPDGAGLDRHADELTAAMEKVRATPDEIHVASIAPATPAPAPPASGALTQSGIIRFVINTLEGGGKLVDNGDGAGATKYGITQKFNPGVDIAGLTEDQAARIARDRYWLREFNDQNPQVAAIAFDANYLAGPDTARAIIRGAEGDPAKALTLYRAALDRVIARNPDKAKFRKGWNSRLDKLEAYVTAHPQARLAPEVFGEDLAAYRAQQAALDAEALQIDAASLRDGEAVRDYLDALDRGDTAAVEAYAADFARDNAAALALEQERRAWLGTDGAARPDAADIAGTAAPARPAAPAPESILAVRRYVSDTRGSLKPEALAKALDLAPEEARRALDAVAQENGTRLQTLRAKDGAVRYRRRAPERTLDAIAFLAKHGGIDRAEWIAQTGNRDDRYFAPQFGALLRKNGLPLDRARELLHEAGYFYGAGPDAGDTLDINDLIDLVETSSKSPVYALADLDAMARRAEEQGARQTALEALNGEIISQGLKLRRGDRNRALDLMLYEGLDENEALVRVVNEQLQDAFDKAWEETPDDYYAQLADEFAALYEENPRGRDETDGGYPGFEGDQGAGPGRAGEPGGLDPQEIDPAPAPLDPARQGVDDPYGPEAAALAADLLHDLRAAIDPAIAERQAQETALKAAAPLQAKVDQESTIGAPLFDAADQSRLFDIDGTPMTAADLLADLDADQAAINAIRGCL